MSASSGTQSQRRGHCFLCGARFAFGPTLFEGRSLLEWRLIVCDDCVEAQPEGIEAEKEPVFVGYLNACHIEFEIGTTGRIAWPPSAAVKPTPRPTHAVAATTIRQ